MVYDHRKLKVWQKAVDLHNRIVRITLEFPKHEKYALGDQMRRSSESISSNIAEGSGQNTIKSYISYLHNSIGSKKELESQVELAFRNGYVSQEKRDELLKELNEIGKMLWGVVKFLRDKDESVK